MAPTGRRAGLAPTLQLALRLHVAGQGALQHEGLQGVLQRHLWQHGSGAGVRPPSVIPGAVPGTGHAATLDRRCASRPARAESKDTATAYAPTTYGDVGAGVGSSPLRPSSASATATSPPSTAGAYWRLVTDADEWPNRPRGLQHAGAARPPTRRLT